MTNGRSKLKAFLHSPASVLSAFRLCLRPMRISRHRQVFHVYSDRLKWNKQVVNIHMHIVYHIHFPTLSQIWNCLTSLFLILQILFNSQWFHVLLLLSCHLDVFIYKCMYVFAMSFSLIEITGLIDRLPAYHFYWEKRLGWMVPYHQPFCPGGTMKRRYFCLHSTHLKIPLAE